MPSDDEYSDRHRSKRNRYRDDRNRQDRRSRSVDREPERDRDSERRRRHRSRSRSKQRRRRSRTPDSPRRRPRDHDAKRRSRRSPSPQDSRSRRDRDRDRPRKSSASPPRKRASPLRRTGPLPSQDASFALIAKPGEEPPKPKEKPNYGTTGLLAAASNSVAQADGTSITLKYHEPPEARKPPAKDDWRLFVFKGGDVADTVGLSARSCWLVGREAAVVDLLAEHPSISKQHAVVQFRYVEKRNEFGERTGRVKPYLIDLESANGTVLNGDKVPASRYLELRAKDVVKFGHSSREYVLVKAD